MKKLVFSGSIFLLIISFLGHVDHLCYARGVDELTRKVSDGILGYFADKTNTRTAIVKFENFSDLSDQAAQKFYQVLVSSLESSPPSQLVHIDLMVNFQKKRGEFNLNRIDRLNYLIYIKLIKHRDKLGAGVAIFSRTLDKLVYIQYFEENVPAGDREVYDIRDYGFKGTGFSSLMEIDADKNLLDFKTVINPDNAGNTGNAATYRYFFYYPDKIDIFVMEDNSFKKFFTYQLDWGRPYFPVLNKEGRLCLFYHDNGLYISVGSNFSPLARIFRLKDNLWKEIAAVDFTPIKLVRINQNDYLAGARYDEGKNFFRETLVLMPFISGELDNTNRLEKRIPSFYSIDFSTARDEENGEAPLESIHLIDRDYNYRFLAGDFEERAVEPGKRGSSLAALDGSWLAVSDYSTDVDKDKLYFYKIEEGSKRLVYENPIRGQAIFISPGAWKDRRGFWVYVKRDEGNREEYAEYRLQFWSKKNDE